MGTRASQVDGRTDGRTEGQKDVGGSMLVGSYKWVVESMDGWIHGWREGQVDR